ncbi:hypothetical protein [Virgisporangium aurantiacum]|uniref:Right handed beta helix domain-containing protein n=1 Tax=Virgisporangium aurantiacum TaxID=175570 RepID=A0A8J3Z8J9_9ACTN|nr:hypothetical protein [Virgisporangium aurantiacum]GIJ57186.1 hypothetical protein Vau01_047020 [Virgisporangium aurantiacum]
MLDDAQPSSGRTFWSRGKVVAAAASVAVVAVAVTGYGVVRLNTTSADASAGSPRGADSSTAGGAAAQPAGSDASSVPSVSPSASASAHPSSSAAGSPRYNGYPDASNTGVPAGTKLSNYSGPCTITVTGTVVEAKTVNCDTFEVRARNVVIRKSKINGILVTTERQSFSFTLEDSEVNAGLVGRAAVGSTNITIRRSNIHGGQTSVACAGNCDIRDSYLHGQQMPAGSDWHLGAFLANDVSTDGKTNATLIHNTIICDNPGNEQGGGCSGDINLYPDFGPISNITLRDNLFGANEGISYCVYGGSSKKEYASGVNTIVFVNNVVQRGKNKKCGYWGAVTSFDPSRPGNRWENNRWDDGTPLRSEN